MKKPQRSPKLRPTAKPGKTRKSEAATDDVLLKRSLERMRTAIRVVKKALPGADPEAIGGFFANLFDLWETGQKLDEKLQMFTEFSFPRDRDRLRDVLIWIDAIQIDMATYWIREVRKDLPKLLRALDKLESQSITPKKSRKSTSAQGVRKQNRTHPVAPSLTRLHRGKGGIHNHRTA